MTPPSPYAIRTLGSRLEGVMATTEALPVLDGNFKSRTISALDDMISEEPLAWCSSLAAVSMFYRLSLVASAL